MVTAMSVILDGMLSSTHSRLRCSGHPAHWLQCEMEAGGSGGNRRRAHSQLAHKASACKGSHAGQPINSQRFSHMHAGRQSSRAAHLPANVGVVALAAALSSSCLTFTISGEALS